MNPGIDLDHRFNYHRPDEDKKKRHQEARDIHKDAAERITELTAPGREQSLALTKLEEAMFWTNAAIARE